jgi:hypothetical protein
MGQSFFNKIITNASNPKKNPLFTNIKEIKPYDLKYKNNTKSKDNYFKNRLTTYIDSNNVDECLPYKSFSTKMRKFNNEQSTLVDDVLLKKEKHPSNPLHILIGGVGTEKTFTLMCIIKTCYHITYEKHLILIL